MDPDPAAAELGKMAIEIVDNWIFQDGGIGKELGSAADAKDCKFMEHFGNHFNAMVRMCGTGRKPDPAEFKKRTVEYLLLATGV